MKEMNNNDRMLSENSGMDLEQMREQLGILKQKLDKQSIVTDKLLHQAMEQKMSWITKYCWFAACVIFPFICISWWFIKDWMGLSLLSYFLLIILTGGCITADIIINKMKPEDWEKGNLLQTAVKLASMKHIRKVQTSIQLGLLIVLVIIMGYDAYTANVIPHEELQVMGISMLVGLVIGGACGLRILAKMQRTNDDIIQQIKELTQNQE